MMLLTLVAGSRLTLNDPRHEDGTRRDELFEEAVAAAMRGILPSLSPDHLSLISGPSIFAQPHNTPPPTLTPSINSSTMSW